MNQIESFVVNGYEFDMILEGDYFLQGHPKAVRKKVKKAVKKAVSAFRVQLSLALPMAEDNYPDGKTACDLDKMWQRLDEMSHHMWLIEKDLKKLKKRKKKAKPIKSENQPGIVQLNSEIVDNMKLPKRDKPNYNTPKGEDTNG